MQSLTDDIKNWFHTQKDWLQEAAERLLKNRELNTKDIDDLITLIKSAEGMKVTTHRTFDELMTYSSTNDELRLHSIGEISGIGSLAPKKPLSFGTENLVVIFGHNGSGKSSYSKIIKNISGKPRAGELKSNVFSTPPTSQKCKINYSHSLKPYELDWHTTNPPINQLRAIDFFDSEESQFYLSKENPVSYTPRLITVFEDLAKACDNIKQNLSTQKDSLISSLPDIPQAYSQIELAQRYYTLKPNMSELDIQHLILWRNEDDSELKLLNERLQEENPLVKAKQLKDTKFQVDQLITIIKYIETSCNDENLSKLQLLQEDLDKKKIIAQESASMINKGLLEGVGTDTWKVMWEAARNYSTKIAYPSQKYPVLSHAKCVLCHQDLSLDAQHRLESFEEYIQGKLEADIKLAEAAYKKALTVFPKILTLQEIGTLCKAANLDDNWVQCLERYFSSVKLIHDMVSESNFSKQIIELHSLSDNIRRLVEYSISLENQSSQFERDAQTFNRSEVENKKFHLELRKWIHQQEEAVRKEIERLKQLEQYTKWISAVNSKTISTKASEIADQLITQSYVDRFNTELNNLGATRLKVELVRTKVMKGSPLHRMQLKSANQHIPVESILSEGERRIVTLAAFLADVAEKPHTAPFIFDDPISSLDQIWEEKTIERLIALSQTRQVIVFTHRLSMLGMLTEKADKIHTVHIRQESWGSGETGEIPLFGKKPEAALKDLQNNRIVKARKAFDNSGYEEYYPLAKAICSDIRILVERIVELVFLADVIQRHRRAINTLGKIHKLARIQVEDCHLIEELMTKYSCYEHSQPFESPVDVPEPDELNKDIQKILEWHSEFDKRTA